MASQAMDIDGLLASTATVDQGGARTFTDRGELVFDLAALTEALRLRWPTVHAPGFLSSWCSSSAYAQSWPQLLVQTSCSRCCCTSS